MPSCNVPLPSACSMITGDKVAFSITHKGGGVGIAGLSYGLGSGRYRVVGNGVTGYSDEGAGVVGTSDQGGTGVAGRAENGGDGVYGESYSGGSGVHGYSESPTGYGVWGENPLTAGVAGYSQNIGVSGVCSGGAAGVAGFSGPGTNAVGVYGDSKEGTGVMASSQTGPALSAFSSGDVSALFAGGDVHIGSSLNVSSETHTRDLVVEDETRLEGWALITTLFSPFKFFRIDHPLDPANKYLLHASVESSERKNLYDGIAKLDRKGEAVVAVPKWFEALNRDIRYQLCALASPSPELHIREELENGKFRIAGGKPGARVCWQVTGVRQDAAARYQPMQVEQEKPAGERGYYQAPEAHGKPLEKGINYRRSRRLRGSVNPAEKLDLARLRLQPPVRPLRRQLVLSATSQETDSEAVIPGDRAPQSGGAARRSKRRK